MTMEYGFMIKPGLSIRQKLPDPQCKRSFCCDDGFNYRSLVTDIPEEKKELPAGGMPGGMGY